MKKILTLTSALLMIAGSADAQLVSKTSASGNVHTVSAANAPGTYKGRSAQANDKELTPATGHKTTLGGGRWYNYVDGILAPDVPSTGKYGLEIWYDTTSIWGATSTTTTYRWDQCTSVGLGFNPMYGRWNNPLVFPGEIAVSITDSFSIDSVFVRSLYNRNLSKPTVVDTLIFTFVQGSGDTASDLAEGGYSGSGVAFILARYGIPSTGSLDYLNMFFDHSNHRAGANGTTSVLPASSTDVYKFLLYPADTNSTDYTRGTKYPRSIRPVGAPADPVINYAVHAGNYSSMSVTFRSGDATYPAFPTHDTVRYSSGTAITGYKYDAYTPVVAYADSLTGTVIFPPYHTGNYTSGYFKFEGFGGGWDDTYIPNWPWTTSVTFPSRLQYPYIGYHISCTTCPLTDIALNVKTGTDLSHISATPNPANDELAISFTLAAGTSASVTLTGLLGQVVAVQGTTNGNAVFNTSALPAGIYLYTVHADGEKATGRVVISH